MAAVIELERRTHLFQVIDTLQSLSRGPYSLHCGQKKAKEYAYDSDDDEKLD
jgi:hypothetical protein